MTEAEWLEEEFSDFALLDYLCKSHRLNRTKAGRRKFWLVGCGCCRLMWNWVELIPTAAALVLAAERFADGETKFTEVSKRDAELRIPNFGRNQSVMFAARGLAYSNVMIVATFAIHHYAEAVVRDSLIPAVRTQLWSGAMAQATHLIRCIFGNPFRPVAFNPSWRTDTAVILAQQMYNSREFTAMPILADALQDAGCEDEQVLSHCRDAGPHARGCWVVDGVLGKA